MSRNDLDLSGNTLPSSKQNFPDLEETVLQHWKTDGTFLASLEQRSGSKAWRCYDGPPFANGLPHYGHLLTGYAKDTFPRFQTMRGKYVERQFGWDTHGLPAELEAMKRLGLTEKHEVEAMGVDVFNATAKSSVLQYVDDWREYVDRQGRWVDFDGGYKTLDLTYMESVLWAFKNLHDKGLAYEGYRVLPYCWKDQTPLSNHELNMDDDVYRERTDMSVTATFPMTGDQAEALGLLGVSALAWTTTPWTLPMNLALAVNPAMVYAVLHTSPESLHDGRYLLAASCLEAYAAELGYESLEAVQAAVEFTVTGDQLSDVEYEPVFSYYTDTAKWGTKKAFRFLLAEYVNDGSGTGVVHQAPAHGEEDQKTCEAAGVPAFLSVDEGACFLPEVADFAGLNVFEAVKPVMAMLAANGRLFSKKAYVHDYPHCWRCKTPLVYKAVSSWFVKVTAFRDRMVELNQEVNWTPNNVKHGVFGKWVENARDWSVSRNRYWGSPVPVWKSDNPEYPRTDVYGSLADMESDFGVTVTDLHRPFVDNLVRPNPDDPTGHSMMRRVEDVLDVWFDSGAMPFAKMHYPFENKETFEENHPADFVVEYVGQTRGWFYVMHALSTALFDRPAFKNAVSHGVVLGNDGQKMSKSSKNYPDVNEVFNRDGSDAMRWFLLSSPALGGGNLVVTDQAVTDSMRQVMLPLWNTYYFYKLYADGHKATWRTDSTDVLDHYVLSKLHNLTADVTASLEAFDSATACQQLAAFMDMLNNWYVRRSRPRFWDGNDANAFDTLYTVLETLARLSAPLLPMLTEAVWKGLTGGRSVHLTDYPKPHEFPVDYDGADAMDAVRTVSSVALSLRKKFNLRVRQPLASLTVAMDDAAALEVFAPLLCDELNVKKLVLVDDTEAEASRFNVVKRLKVDARSVGRRLGKEAQPVFTAARANDWVESAEGVLAGGVLLQSGEFSFTMESSEGTDNALSFLPGGGFVVLDTHMSPELEAEGLSRDVLRAVQNARRSAGFNVSDRVHLGLLFASENDRDAFLTSGVDVASEVLAVSMTVHHGDSRALLGFDPEHVETLTAGEYATRDGFSVALSVAQV